MHHRRFRKPSKPTIFAMLMVLSAGMALLPRDFFSPFRNLTQLVAVPQYGATAAARHISKSAKDLRSPPISQAKHAEALAARKALENENVALLRKLHRLQEMVADLQQLRSRPQFPANGRLIPARVVGWDAVPERDSMVLMKKSRPEVRQGDWITSRLAIESGQQDGLHENMDDMRLLARETLIGWIEQTGAYFSRAVLLSDAYSRRKWYVHIASVGREGRGPSFVMHNGQPADFALEGIGKGRMRILDINARFINEGLIRPGDVVTTDGRDPKLPLPMVVGEIVEFEQIKNQPLLYHAIVKHRCDPKDISDVYIVDMPQQ